MHRESKTKNDGNSVPPSINTQSLTCCTHVYRQTLLGSPNKSHRCQWHGFKL